MSRLLASLGLTLPILFTPALKAESEQLPVDITEHPLTAYDICIHDLLLNGDDTLTVGEIREQCEESKIQAQPLTQRRISEIITEKNPFVLTPHRLNYVMFGHYMPRVNQAPFDREHPDKERDFNETEVQFQLSFKVPLIKKALFDSVDLYAAYTNRSFWQFFDDKNSIPFRETNHEPELWAELQTNVNFLNFNLHKVLLGVNHQSNGQSGTLSRGWNRMFIQGFFQRENSYASFKTWQRFKEKDSFDNSFSYTKYIGDYELELGYRSNKHTYGVTYRNRYMLNSYGAIQLDYTYPLSKKIKGYVQWFSGYGDSLIDMDFRTNKIGIGIVLADRI